MGSLLGVRTPLSFTHKYLLLTCPLGNCHRLTNDSNRRVQEQSIILLQNITASSQEIALTVKGLGADGLVDLLQAAMSKSEPETVEHVSMTNQTPAYPHLVSGHPRNEQHNSRISARAGSNKQGPPDSAEEQPLSLISCSPACLGQLCLRAPCTLPVPPPRTT